MNPDVAFAADLERALASRNIGLAPDVDTTKQVGQWLLAIRAVWPSLDAPPESFAGHVAAHLAPGPVSAQILAQIHVVDLYFAWVCAAGEPKAALALRQRLHPIVERVLRRRAADSWFADEVMQALLDKLLVPVNSSSPKILDYAGRGPLDGWLRVAATRQTIDLERRRGAREVGAEEPLLYEGASSLDPELEYIRARHADDFATAFRHAFDGLSARERNVLRLYLVDGLDIGRIGAIYRVHRATVARWISRARDAIVSECHRALVVRLGATNSEVESLVRAVREHVELGLVELLEAAAPEAPEDV